MQNPPMEGNTFFEKMAGFAPGDPSPAPFSITNPVTPKFVTNCELRKESFAMVRGKHRTGSFRGLQKSPSSRRHAAVNHV